MPVQSKGEVDKFGRFIDSASGLLVPESYQRWQMQSAFLGQSGITLQGFNNGYALDRDENTFAVKWPRKGSGQDDLICQYIVDGMVANVGVSPVVAPQISAMVRKQQNQAVTASIDVTGRTSPMKKARDAIALFNDSPLGATDALETLTYRLCTYNRGAPIATVPITFAFEDWADYGLTAVPIVAPGQPAEGINRFYLEVDWARVGTPIPFLPSPFDLEPTGVQQWPYWYRARSQDGQSSFWVLLHSSQIIEVTSGKSGVPGIGHSPVWMCLGILAEQILITDERVEKMLYSLTDGIILLGGVQGLTGQQVEDRVAAAREAHLEQGLRAAKGTAILTSPLDKVSYVQINFRQPPGVEFKDWREYAEDVIALAFGETLSTLVTRGGIGYGAQTDTASDNAAETGVGAYLTKIGSALGAIYPRVQISVSRPNDRAQRINIATLQVFSQAATPMIAAGVFSAGQAAAIIDRDILSLPPVDTVTSSANPNDDQAGGETSAGSNTTSTSATGTTSSGTTGSGQATRSALRALLHEARQFAAQALYGDAEVTITDADVDQALALARRRVDDRVYGLLTAEPVED